MLESGVLPLSRAGVVFCIENLCFRKTKQKTPHPAPFAPSLCVFLHSAIISCEGAVLWFAPFHNYESQQGAFINVMLIFCIQLILSSTRFSPLVPPVWKMYLSVNCGIGKTQTKPAEILNNTSSLFPILQLNVCAFLE